MQDETWNPIAEGVAPLSTWDTPRRVRLAHDLFDRRITTETIRAAWDAMWAAPTHRFIVCADDTKRLRKWARRNAFMRHFGWTDFDRLPTLDYGETIHMDNLYYRGRCGWVNDGIEDNNGYGCSHPENEEDGQCFSFACPIAFPAGLCVDCRKSEDDCTCKKFYESDDLMELWRRPRYAVARNVWVGTRVSTREEAETRIPDIMQTPAAVRFVETSPGLDVSEWVNEGEAISRTTGSSTSVERTIAWVVTNGVWTSTTETPAPRKRRRLPVVTP